MQVDGAGVRAAAVTVGVRPGRREAAPGAAPGVPTPPSGDGDVLHLDTLERLARRVADLLARRPDGPRAVPGTAEVWLAEVDELLTAPPPGPGDHDRAALLAARAAVLLPGASGVLAARTPDAGDVARAHDDAAAAARLFEGTGDVLAAATGHAVAALAAIRAGEVGQALDDAVHALVAFGSLPDGQRDPDGEAHLAELLARLCLQFFDHDRAQQFYELAARSLRARAGEPGDARLARVQARLADLLLLRAGDTGPDAAEPGRGTLLERADVLARGVLSGPLRDEGLRLLAARDCASGRCAEGLELLAGLPEGTQDEPRLRLTRARCRHGVGDEAGALADLDVAVEASAAQGDLALHIEALQVRSQVREATSDLPGALADARTLGDLVWQRHRRQVGGFMDQVWSRAGVEGQRRDLEAQARVLLRFAEQDSLTSLANRRGIEQFCGSLRATEHVCLVLVDVDHFKDVNDRHGHLVGDVVLREVAAVLSGSVRSVDRVARWGGEEFLIALPGGTAVLGAEAAARLRRRVEDHAWAVHAPGLRLTVSAGVSAGPAGDFAAILARADAAVYAAKRAGRNRVVTS